MARGPYTTIDELSAQWTNNPEPASQTLGPTGDVILDTQDATADAYFWEPHNCTEGWLQYDGPLMEVEQ